MMPTDLSPLLKYRQRLLDLSNKNFGLYRVPGLWLGTQNRPQSIPVSPIHLMLDTVDTIIDTPPKPLDHLETTGGDWSRYATIYNLFVRTTLAFDHNHDGILSPQSDSTLSESGTFAKAILLLPYIQSLGCNTIHLLPITKIGKDGNKGNAGSPYAICNPYKIEESLCEPLIGLGAEAEFDAFVSAAHHLGIRIVLEFVFRTTSKDADLVKNHPDWFYWINSNIPDRQVGTTNESAYGMPLFTKEEAEQIKSCLLYTSPSPRDLSTSRMPSSA